LDLLKRILVYDPKKRISAEYARLHPYFKSVNEDAYENIEMYDEYLTMMMSEDKIVMIV